MVHSAGQFYPIEEGFRPITSVIAAPGEPPKLEPPFSPGHSCPLPLLQTAALRNDGASIPSEPPSSAGSSGQQDIGRPAPSPGKLVRANSRGSLAAWFDDDAPLLPKDSPKERGPFSRSEELGRRRKVATPVARRSSVGGATAQMLSDVEASMAETAPVAWRRRTMAAIAGGGFRGPQAAQQPRQCMCEVLKTRLARAQAEIRELRCGRHQASSAETPLFDACHAGTQTDPPPRPPATLRVASPPRPTTREVGTQSRSASHEVAVQITPFPPVRPRLVSAGMQTNSGPECAHSCTQTSAVAVAEGGCQTEPPPAAEPEPRSATKDAEVQAAAVAQPAATAEASTQALPEPLRDFALQAGCSTWDLRTASSQTEPRPAAVEAAVQADPPPPARAEPPRLASASAQTEPPARVAMAAQTDASPAGTSIGVQVVPARGVDKGTQRVDEAAAAREAVLATLAERVQVLSTESAELVEAVQTSKEDGQTWRSAAQSSALGRLNITILCPRAECTVNGERITMDSWNPDRLRAEFEKEVLPRFSKLFVDETAMDSKVPKPRPEAVERTMQEFADVFRKRLTAMLTAPSAAAAVAASGPGAPVRRKS